MIKRLKTNAKFASVRAAMKRTRVKICGITTAADAALAVHAGADAIGLIFHAKSPRNIDLQQAQAIKASLPPFVASVAVFRNASEELVSTVAKQLQPTYLQFHGDEPPAFCRQFDTPFIKAVPMGDEATDVDVFARDFSQASALLLDSHGGEQTAGQGKVFDWQRVPESSSLPLILAGGLSGENVAAAIDATQPYAVDVASGVEQEPGRKSLARINEFFRGVNNAR